MKHPQIKNDRINWTIIASLIYSFAFIIILVLAYTGNLPSRILSKIPYYDTILHFLLYGIATYLGHKALKRRKIKILNYKIALWPLSFGILTVAEEYLQSFSVNRTFSTSDTIASLLGLIFGYWSAERKNK